MCLDPFGNTGLHLLGNVVHAIHERKIGKLPVLPEEFKHLVNKGIIKDPETTRIKEFLNSANEFFPGIKDEAKHLGSMYTYRAVLPNREHDDARPTLIRKMDKKTWTVFAGKIANCVDAAEILVESIKTSQQEGAVNG